MKTIQLTDGQNNALMELEQQIEYIKNLGVKQSYTKTKLEDIYLHWLDGGRVVRSHYFDPCTPDYEDDLEIAKTLSNPFEYFTKYYEDGFHFKILPKKRTEVMWVYQETVRSCTGSLVRPVIYLPENDTPNNKNVALNLNYVLDSGVSLKIHFWHKVPTATRVVEL